jgi:hypothetical protein
MQSSEQLVQRFQRQLMDLRHEMDQVQRRLRSYKLEQPVDEEKVLQAEFEMEMLRGGIENLQSLIGLQCRQ